MIKGHRQRLLIHPTLLSPTVIAEEVALVRGVHNDRILRESVLIQEVQQAAYILIDGVHAA
jgi:hypothetical protein